MKVAILAGGRGTRLAEETALRPKPMVEIGGRPILWHIMKHYACYGHDDFTVALGYKGEIVKRWFLDYYQIESDLTVQLRNGLVDAHHRQREDWSVSLIDTGHATMTGGRVLRLREHLGDERFFLTWGDGVSTVDLDALLAFHEDHGKLITMTAVRPPARFGHLELDGSLVTEFSEKPQTGEGWINGAFFVCEPGIFDYLHGDEDPFERGALGQLAKDGELMAYLHHGFWQCMDTVRDRLYLNELWESGEAPWRCWED